VKTTLILACCPCSFPNDDAALKLLYLAIKNAASAGGAGLNGPLRWASLPLRSARVSRDRRDDPGGANHRKNRRAFDVHQPSNSVARVWPTSKPCKGWPAAPAFGG
jgi:hypothetical protein